MSLSFLFCYLILYFNVFSFCTVADFPSRQRNCEGLVKDGVQHYTLGWRWSIRVQLCILPLSPVRGTKRNQVTLCTCSPILDDRWGNTDGVCGFPFESARVAALVSIRSVSRIWTFRHAMLIQTVYVLNDNYGILSWVMANKHNPTGETPPCYVHPCPLCSSMSMKTAD